MNFLFFLSFAVTVFSHPLRPLLADPVTFVAALANADPETVNKMLSLVSDLEVEGENDRKTVTDDAANKLAISNSMNDALASAEGGLSAAQSSLASAKGIKNELTVREGVEKDALDLAISNRDASQKDADKKQASMEAITSRVTHENEEFDVVLALLDQIVVPAEFLATGRKLLSFTNADPDAVAAVKAQVVALKEAGDNEAAASVELNDAAQAKLIVDIASHAAAAETHTATAGQLQTAISDVDAKTVIRDNAQVERNEASIAASFAAANSDDAAAFRDSEVARINAEAATLVEVRNLLEGLLE